MKNFIAIFAMVFAFAFTATAQTTSTASPQTKNEGFIGYSYINNEATFNSGSLNINRDADAHGVNLGYTRYFAGRGVKTVGFTADLGVNFNGKNDASVVTVMGGLTAKARNSKYVQPYVRALAGVARTNVRTYNLTDFSEVSPAFAVGGGVAFNLKANSRYKFQLGADLLNTRTGYNRENGVRLTAGFTL